MRSLSRRQLLGGAAGIVGAAALPLSRSTQAAAVTPLAGATINLPAYGVGSYAKAAQIFDGYVGLPMATALEKLYMGISDYPPSPPRKMTQLAAVGCQFVISVKPSPTMTAAEQSRLSNWLTMLKNAGISYRVLLFSEPNDGYNLPIFNNAAAWKKYWSYYAPVVKAAGVLCGYNPGANFQSNALNYFPGNPAPDELWMDYYTTAFRNGGSRLEPLIAMAQAVGAPAGIAEWGMSAVPPVFNPVTMPWWNDYCRYLTHLITAKELTLGAIYFGAVSKGSHAGVINNASDPRIPGIREIAMAIQSAS